LYHTSGKTTNRGNEKPVSLEKTGFQTAISGDAGNRTRVQRSWARTPTSLFGAIHLARRFVRRPSRRRASRGRGSRPLRLHTSASAHRTPRFMTSRWPPSEARPTDVTALRRSLQSSYAGLRSERKRVVGRCVKSRYFFGTCGFCPILRAQASRLAVRVYPSLSKPIIPLTIISIAHMVWLVNCGSAVPRLDLRNMVDCGSPTAEA